MVGNNYLVAILVIQLKLFMKLFKSKKAWDQSTRGFYKELR